MAATFEAQVPALEEVLSHHELKRQDLNRKCTRAMRYEIGIMVVAWKMTKEHFQFPKENLAAKGEKHKTEEVRRVALLKTWNEEVEKESSGATYSQYMIRFHHQGRYDLMDSLCSMVKISHPEASGSGIKVDNAINTLDKKFNKLRKQVESKWKISTKILAQSLTQLPTELKMKLDTMIQNKLPGVEDALRVEMSISQLLSQLDPLFTFANYNLLNFLISKHGSTPLKADMISYVRNTEAFMSNTTVHEAMLYWPGDKVCHKDFSQLWIKVIPNDPSTYTLRELNDFRTQLCSKIEFSNILVNLGWIEPSSSVDVVWLVPKKIVHELSKAISKVDKSFHKENIQMILLEEELLYLYISAKGGGYTCKFTSNPSECHMCHSTLRDPHTVTCCNKNFCKPCIAMVKKNDGQCPLCERDFELHPYKELNEALQTCITDKEQLLIAFKCHLCNYILHDPHTVSCCKENFCKSCIMKVKEDHGRCPKCGSLPQAYAHFPNQMLHEVILQFEVYCMNKCSWKGVLKEHNIHLNINPSDQTWLEGCGLVQVECIHCKLEIHERSRLRYCLMCKIEIYAVYQITVSEVYTKWKDIGLKLGLDHTSLKSIKDLCPRYKTEKDCYHDMLKKWSQSTTDANYKKLLDTFRSKMLKLESLAKTLETALLCNESSGLKVDQLTKEAQKLKEEYEAQRSRVNDLMDEIEIENESLEEKRQELAELNFAYSNAKQESAHVQRNLTDVNNHLRKLEQNIAAIEQDILDGEKTQQQQIRHILKAEKQLKATKEQMETCLKSLSEQIEYLKGEKTLKLQEYMRPQPESQQVGSRAEAGRAIAAATGSLTAAAAVATFTSGPLGFLAAAAAIGIGTYSWLTAGPTTKPQSDGERERTEAKYKKLIKKCIDEIENMKPILKECKEKLKKMKEIVHLHASK